jgi:hypothetical protein
MVFVYAETGSKAVTLLLAEPLQAAIVAMTGLLRHCRCDPCPVTLVRQWLGPVVSPCRPLRPEVRSACKKQCACITCNLLRLLSLHAGRGSDGAPNCSVDCTSQGIILHSSCLPLRSEHSSPLAQRMADHFEAVWCCATAAKPTTSHSTYYACCQHCHTTATRGKAWLRPCRCKTHMQLKGTRCFVTPLCLLSLHATACM